MNLIILKLYY